MHETIACTQYPKWLETPLLIIYNFTLNFIGRKMCLSVESPFHTQLHMCVCTLPKSGRSVCGWAVSSSSLSLALSESGSSSLLKACLMYLGERI